MRRALVAFSLCLCLTACESGSAPGAVMGSPSPAALEYPPLVVTPVEPPAPDAGANEEPVPDAPTAPEPARPVIGTFESWVASYTAASTPETFRPPQLRVLGDLRDVPRSTLVFQRSGHLHRLDLPGGKGRQLTDGAGHEGAPEWTADGRQLFFLSNREDAKDRVYRMPAEGGSPRAVTRGLRRGSGFTWAVSRDGSQIAYVHGTTPDGVHLVDVASGDDRVVAISEVEYVSFSRDAATLFVVHGHVTENASMSSVDVRTGGVQGLRVPRVAEIGQPWDLGDGRLLLVSSGDFSMMGRSPHFVTMAATGGGFASVGRFDVPIGYLSADLSPDRKRIAGAWSQRQGGLGAAWFQDVSVIDLPTGAVRAPRLSAKFPRPFYQANEPSWAPDSRHLALTLSVCARGDCQPLVRSVVLVDAEHPDEIPVFLAEGGAAAFRPEPGEEGLSALVRSNGASPATRSIICVSPAPVVTSNVAVRSPLAVGVCVTVKPSVPAPASVCGSALAKRNVNSAAFAPPTVAEAIVRLPTRMLVRVADAITGCPLKPGKKRLFGAQLKAGVSSDARFWGSHAASRTKSAALLPVSIGLP